jgi:cystathionine beta-lyase
MIGMNDPDTTFRFDAPPDRRGTGSLKWDRYADRDVIPLWVADMDFQSPPAVMEALGARAAHGVFGYTAPYPAVVDQVLRYLREAHGVAAEADWLYWVPGLVPALNLACRAFAEEGEGVLTCTPVYPPFLSAPLNGARVLQRAPLQVRRDGSWGFDWKAMEDAADASTRVFILCNPHNPVGRVYSRDELDRLAAFCDRRNLVLISDEIHCDLILDDGLRHVPTLSLGADVAARTVTLMSPSKTYNLPGLACAYAIIPNPDLRARLRRTCRGIITEVNAFGYTACLAAYRDGDPWRQALLRYLRENRDELARAVAERMPGVVMAPMEATYLAWLDVRALGLERPAEHFVEHGVGLSNGVDFGAPGFLRVNFGCSRTLLREGMERMVRAVAAAPGAVAPGEPPR